MLSYSSLFEVSVLDKDEQVLYWAGSLMPLIYNFNLASRTLRLILPLKVSILYQTDNKHILLIEHDDAHYS